MTIAEIFDSVKQIPIMQVVERYCLLDGMKKTSGKIYIRSPFVTSDKSPSLCIYTNTNSFCCFSTRKGGDVVKLVALIFGLTNSESAKKIADDFGLVVDAKVDRKKLQEKIKAKEAEKKEAEKIRQDLKLFFCKISDKFQYWRNYDDDHHIYVCGCNGEWIYIDRIAFIIDGHNRYDIANRHNLKYTVLEMEFDSREDVKKWIVFNQFGRRNLSAYDRSVLALKLEDVFREMAKENSIANGGDKKSDNAKSHPQISADAILHIETRLELAKTAGVSHDTISKVKAIEAKATTETKKKIQQGELSINRAYKDIQ